MTLEDYFHFEEQSLEKHEFYGGPVMATAGDPKSHDLITANFIGLLRDRLQGKACQVCDSSFQRKVSGTPPFVHPDAAVIVGPAQFGLDDADGKTVANPRLVIEVLSADTEVADRGEKFQRYLRLSTLEEYVQVAQDAPRVETYVRQSDGSWRFREIVAIENSIHLESLNIDITMADVYANVTLPIWVQPDDGKGEVREVIQ